MLCADGFMLVSLALLESQNEKVDMCPFWGAWPAFSSEKLGNQEKGKWILDSRSCESIIPCHFSLNKIFDGALSITDLL